MAKHEDMLKVFGGKHILFLERDCSLSSVVRAFEKWLIENKIHYNVLYDVGNLSLSYIEDQLRYGPWNFIAFQSTWTTDVTQKMYTAFKNMEMQYSIVECYINEPHFYYTPKSIANHVVYVLTHCGICSDDSSDFELIKLRKRKSIWEK